MKLSDLKTGMWVKLRNERMYVFLKDYETKLYGSGIFVYLHGGFEPYSNYQDDMKFKDRKNNCFDIVEVFKPLSTACALDANYLTSIWKRVEIPQLAINVLNSFDPECKWIAKDNDGKLFIYSEKPIKEEYCWMPQNLCLVFKSISFIFKNELFNWLSWEDKEPCYIPDLIGEQENEN